MKYTLLLFTIVLAMACLTSAFVAGPASVDDKFYSQPSLQDSLHRVIRSLRKRPCVCTHQYRPVCGSDNRSYGNACVLRCETEKNPNLRHIYDGECSSENNRNINVKTSN